MKKLILLTLFALMGCSSTTTTLERVPSQHKVQSFVPEKFNKTKHLLSDDEGEQLSKVLQERTEGSLAFEENDRPITLIVNNYGHWIKTVQGSVFFINHLGEVKKVQTETPISSFSFESDRIQLYNANDAGRFCTFTELEKKKDRDYSCHYIHATKAIGDL